MDEQQPTITLVVPSEGSTWSSGQLITPTSPKGLGNMGSRPAEPGPVAPTQGHGRKKGTACVRCRTQKVRCDDQQPACANCARMGQTCLRPGLGIDSNTLSHLSRTETRLRWLENALRQVAPEKLEEAPYVGTADHRAGSTGPIAESTTSETGPGCSQSDQGLKPWDTIGSFKRKRTASFQSLPNEGATPNLAGAQTSPASVASAQIKPNESLAHEVGLLSLTNATESKYLGPSSGVPFARLIFSTIPQSQGLATCIATSVHGPSGSGVKGAQPFPQDWIFQEDLQHFLDAYFETYAPLYPFLDEETTRSCLHALYQVQSTDGVPLYGSHSNPPQLSDMIERLSHPMLIQVLLIVAIGSHILENRLSTDFDSERYLATGMAYLGSLALHDNIEGLQIMLLLTLCSMDFPDGPNGWFLTANIIASCLDLGFQRKWIEITAPMTSQQRQQIELRKSLRSGIFWSAYSLERQMAVVLGRPLTLRDEAIDIEFPGSFEDIDQLNETGRAATGLDAQGYSPAGVSANPKQSKTGMTSQSPAPIAHFSFRFDQILAEIKLTMHRVINKPNRFPWPTDTDTFQSSMHRVCDELYDELTATVKRQTHRSTPNHTVRNLEVKYHHCLLLLYRPSPAVPNPSFGSWRICYHSAVRTIHILAELRRFCKLDNSWLTAHTTFVCSITFLYCLWVSPTLLRGIPVHSFTRDAQTCASLLEHLGKTWTVASDALSQFRRLEQATLGLWNRQNEPQQAERPRGDEQTTVSLDQSTWPDIQQTHPASFDPSNDTHFQGSMNDFGNLELEAFHTELGGMKNWFDLGWISQSQSFGV